MGYVLGMGLLANILRRPNDQKVASSTSYKSITEYAPAFSTYQGSLYEQALTRAAVERIAVACSKLKPEVQGSAKPRIQRAIHDMPNDFMTWPQLIYRVATCLEADTTAFVVPSFDERMENMVGLWPLKAEDAEVVEYQGEAWVRFYLGSGDTAALPLSQVCILTRFQYRSDFFGSGNGPLLPTLRLVDAQEQAQENAIKTGASIRFIGKVTSLLRPEDLEKKRKDFSDQNLSEANKTGLMLYDQSFDDVRQVDPQSYVISSDEMERINHSVHTYFGVNDDILTSDYSEEQWGAFYESVVEPIAVQLGEGLTKLLYTPREIARGNRVSFSANRLEYASNASKRNMIRDMLDRGVMTINEAREVLQLPPVEGGEMRPTRGEYALIDPQGRVAYKSGGDSGDDIVNTQQQKSDFDLGGDDQIYKDNDTRGAAEIDEDS